jgi:hypothetical protein
VRGTLAFGRDLRRRRFTITAVIAGTGSGDEKDAGKAG